jgi:hypothetical protein
VSEAGEFIDTALQYEGSWERASAALRQAQEPQSRVAGAAGGVTDLRFYGASIGAVRGTVRDTLRRYPELDHDAVTALSTELWSTPVFERRLAAIVLLQSRVGLLTNTDLTRLEGFLRSAELKVLVDALATDVVRPLISGLDERSSQRALQVLGRWASDENSGLRTAAALVTPNL